MSELDTLIALFLVFFFGGLLLYGLIGWAAKRAVKYIRRRGMRVYRIKIEQNKTAHGAATPIGGNRNNPYSL